MTTLITGATGFAGGHLVERLLERAPLVGWHRPGKPAPTSPDGVLWQAVDVLDRDGVEGALEESRPERIYHVAGAPRVDTAWQDVVPHLRTNVLGTHHLLDAIRRLGLPSRVVVVSSALVYQPGDQPLNEAAALVPASPYGVSKLAQDQLALRAFQDDRMDVVVARPFNHIGPRQAPIFSVPSFARQIALIEAGRADPTIRVGNLETSRDLSDVRDVVEAYERLMTGGAAGRVYNICSGRAVRIGDVLEQLVALAREPVSVVVDQARLRPEDTPVVVGSADRIRAELGWSPRRHLAETLHDTLEWWRAEIRSPGFA
jgi:GDP-4-dehydro-6-deoxy-D-mannose reductase